MYGQFNTTPRVIPEGERAIVALDVNGKVLTTATPSTPPIGGGITWVKSTATMTGASAVLLAANPLRKAVIISNPSGNAAASIDFTGGTASATSGISLAPSQTYWLTGADCPLGGMTQFGTNAQVLTVYEGT